MADAERYRTDCPKCGAPLAPVALDPQTAPWLCNVCSRGFWAAELTDSARLRYRPFHHDWGQGRPAMTLRDAVSMEWMEAHDRGTSLRHDQLELIDPTALKTMLDRLPVHPDFAGPATAALERRAP